MFLHNDKELFQEVIVSAAEDLDLGVPIVEKDGSSGINVDRKIQQIQNMVSHTAIVFPKSLF